MNLRHNVYFHSLKRRIRSFAKSFGYEIRRLPGSDIRYPVDASESEVEIMRAVKPFTMTSVAQQLALIRAIDHIAENKVPGAIVECGVWRGGSVMACALALIRHKDTERELYLYDTFRGMTEAEDIDILYDGRRAKQVFKANVPYCSQSDALHVRANIASTCYPMERVTLIEGDVLETLEEKLPEKIALLRLDTDWYRSTKREMERLYPLLDERGVLIVDDYGYCKGCQKAVDEYFSPIRGEVFTHRIDYTARLITRLPKARV